ncbi:MAG: UbiA prenyltransferase family protein [Sphingobacteriales bacterium]|nr:UbiA prenyltransferase family protein [Sphingobacteriales bacterium]MBI3719292.1 UbiA prenyltransferase family protein [Sphingobacteriales bacterium]
MPVYWFALSQVPDIDWTKAILIFIILHLIVYPASNGYNSYMDKDETPIGGLANPLQPTKQLFYITIFMDVLAVALSFFINVWFVICIIAYILASRAYSYRGIRLKKYPVAGYLTVILFQGGVTYFMVHYGSSDINGSTDTNPEAMLVATLLIGGFYPLTQIYQHEADKKDGVNTISSMLGYRGTFIFTAVVYAVAVAMLAHLLISSFQTIQLLVLQIFLLPILVYFFIWAAKVWKDTNEANFKNTMRMNLLASTCTNLGFITIFILNHHG